jgi:hypothetical protein
MTYLITGNSLAAVINGRSYSLTSDHPQFSLIRESLLNGVAEEKIAGMFDAAGAASQYLQGEVEARAGNLYYKGEQVHGTIAQRIIDFMERGIPYQPLVEFLKRLLKNPSKRSVEELYEFMEANKLPITEDGYVLGYKGVMSDFKDRYTGTVDNRIGAKPRMERNTVDDNWHVLCSSGYHVGSESYASGFAAKTIIVKIDPADVVSVPDHGDKMRVCAYEVITEYKGTLPKAVALTEDPYKEESGVIAWLKRLFSKNPKGRAEAIS